MFLSTLRSFQSVMLTMSSGQMWNHIHGAQFMHTNPKTGQAVSDSCFVCTSEVVCSFGTNLSDFSLYTRAITGSFAKETDWV